tara:strand:+ start:170 stop:433 length:264 start_codon:yes stop_codon:yes gene_type:complete
MTNYTVAQFTETIDNPSASMGYPIYFVCADGGILSEEAAKAQKSLIVDAMTEAGTNKQWEVIGCDINYENPALYCDHTGELIPSAYL